jgi:hypothetical protein
MTAYAFGNADVTGVPAFNQGFNKNDMVQAPEPQPIPPAPVPTPVPPVVVPPTPTPVPPVVTPPVTPELPPKPPTDYDKVQDAKIDWLTGSFNSLIALLREFAKSILNKFGKE